MDLNLNKSDSCENRSDEKKKKERESVLCAENYVYILLLLRAGSYLENAGLASLERI